MDTEAVSTATIGFLNHLAITELLPGDTRFEVRVPIPGELESGREVRISWKLLHRALAVDDRKGTSFTSVVG